MRTREIFSVLELQTINNVYLDTVRSHGPEDSWFEKDIRRRVGKSYKVPTEAKMKAYPIYRSHST